MSLRIPVMIATSTSLCALAQCPPNFPHLQEGTCIPKKMTTFIQNMRSVQQGKTMNGGSHDVDDTGAVLGGTGPVAHVIGLPSPGSDPFPEPHF